MKPSFALTLTDDTIGLLHRTARGWLEVGQTRFDTPDLTEALSYLRGSAIGLSPRGITTKLVIPNSQILYMEVEAPGPDAAARRAQIKVALEGRTPYAIKDLAFDWFGNGATVQVAVVARETLQEAEAFAEEHRFNPLCFVAIPPPGPFRKEPWFGPSAMAATLLPEGEKVERDQDPVTIVARELPKSTPPEMAGTPAALSGPAPSQPAPQPTASAFAEAALPPATQAEPAPEATPKLSLSTGSAPAETPDVLDATAAAPQEPVAETPPVAVTEQPAAQVVAAPLIAAPVAPPAEAATAKVTPALPAVDAAAESASAHPQLATPAEPPVVVAPVTAPPVVTAPPIAAAPQIASVLDDPLPPAAQQAVAGLSVHSASATQPLAAAAKAATPAPDSVADVPDAPFIEVPDSVPDAPTAAFASRRAEGAPPPLGMAASFSAPKPGKAAPDQPQTRPSVARPVTAPVPRPLGASPARPTVAAAKSAAVTAPSIPGGRGRKAKPAPTPAATPAPAGATAKSGSATMGSFGSRQLPQRGKPRYLGLILTGALLLFLALVAAWSSFYITSRSDPVETDLSGDPLPAGSVDTAAVDTSQITAPDAVAQTDTGTDPAAQDQAVPAVEDEMLADQQDPAELAGDAGETNADVTADLTTDPALPTPVAAVPPALGDAATQAPAVAPQSEAQDEIFLAAMDGPLRQLDALALPLPKATPDAAPAAQLPPPPFGTVYQFDANGSIIATPEGIITPDGITLVSGRPAKVPPARPAALAAAPAVSPPTAGAITPDTPADATLATAAPFPSDPALSGARPRARPETLVPPAATEDDAALPANGTLRLTSRRPEARPASVFARAEEARLATESASLVLASAAGVADQANVSPLAIAVSRKPAARPKDFSKAIDAAVAAAVRQPDTPDVPDARAEPEADHEPEVVASAAPKIPTRASVAKQATFVNAINLSKTNLIGVYGTSSKRYALVRQSNGRYRKVSVGDKVDGGTVAAITASELRYKKGSKMITLAMPKG